MAKVFALRDLTVSQLEKELLARKSTLQDLVVKRNKIRSELSSLDEQIRGLTGEEATGEEVASEQVAGQEAPRRRGRPKGSLNKVRRGKRTKNKQSLKEFVREELLKAKKGLTMDELITAVEANGYKSKAEKFKPVMYQCLFHGEEFKKDPESKRWVLVSE